MNDATLQELLTALRDPNHDARCRAAQELGKAKDNRGLELLISALGDSNEFVRMDVAWALGQIGDTRSVESLIGVLRDPHGFVRREAALALGEIGDNRDIQPLMDIVRSGDKFSGAAAKALSKITSEPVETILLKGAYSYLFRCFVCGHEFSNAATDGRTLIGELITQKGLHCRRCGIRFCAACAPRNSSNELICGCGINLVPYGM